MALHPREARFGRREFVVRSAGGVVGLSSLSTILAACGGGNGGGSSARRPPARTARQPGHLGDLRRQPADRLRARAREGPAQDLQLERLPLAEDHQGLRQGVRRRGPALDVRDHGRVDGEDLVGRGRLRRVLPVPGAARPHGAREAPPAAQPRLRPEPREEHLAGAPGPVLRQGLAVHGPVHDLHDRDRLSHRQGGHDAVGSRQPVRDLLGRAQQGEDVPPRRRPRGPDPHAPEERHHGHEHREAGGHRPRKERAQVAHAGREREALDGRLHERPRGSCLGAPDVVGKRGVCPVVPAGGHRRPRCSATGIRPTASARSGAT